MRFGGHETFAVREGWFSKGLDIVDRNPDAFNDPFVSDSLGVGRNMAKSIFYWMCVTGLVNRESRSRTVSMTDLGKKILSKDPYFLNPATWWALHINLLTRKDKALVWKVFFNTFSRDRFDRVTCMEEIHRCIATEFTRAPSLKTVSRDISCLLASYATPIPPDTNDPEEGLESPFRQLGLVTRLGKTGSYVMNRNAKDIPVPVLGYALSAYLPWDGKERFSDVKFSEAFFNPGSPGKILCLNSEVFTDFIEKAERMLGPGLINIRNLGGSSFIRVKRMSLSDWLGKCYAS